MYIAYYFWHTKLVIQKFFIIGGMLWQKITAITPTAAQIQPTNAIPLRKTVTAPAKIHRTKTAAQDQLRIRTASLTDPTATVILILISIDASHSSPSFGELLHRSPGQVYQCRVQLEGIKKFLSIFQKKCWHFLFWVVIYPCCLKQAMCACSSAG